MTTEINAHFPIGLLQMSIKFTNEPPQGIRASLKRTYADVTQDTLDYSTHASWPLLLYSVAFLHTVVQVCSSQPRLHRIQGPYKFTLQVGELLAKVAGDKMTCPLSFRQFISVNYNFCWLFSEVISSCCLSIVPIICFSGLKMTDIRQDRTSLI